MALFSRRPKQTDQTAEPVAPAAEASEQQTPEVVPEVSISVSTFGAPTAAPTQPSPAAPTQPTPAAPVKPRPRQQVPGISENTLLADALGVLPPSPEPLQILNVARQLLQGQVHLRVRGDARELLAKGEPVPMAVAAVGDKKYVLAFSGGDALQAAVRADGDTGTSAVALPAVQVLRRVIEGDFGGIALDHASGPSAAMVPRALIEKALPDVDDTQAVKQALVGERTEASVAALIAALTTSPVWVAARRNDDGRIGVSEVRTAAGERLLEVFSHPLELHVLGRRDQSVRIEPAQLAKALADDEELLGLVVNPHGPWMRLGREDLAPLIAIAPA